MCGIWTLEPSIHHVYNHIHNQIQHCTISTGIRKPLPSYSQRRGNLAITIGNRNSPHTHLLVPLDRRGVADDYTYLTCRPE